MEDEARGEHALRLRIFGILSASCLVATGCATQEAPVAPPPPTPQQILASASADDFTCTRAEAKELDFSEFSGAPDAYADTCVKLKGLATFRHLYKDGAALAAQKNTPAAGLAWKDETGMKKLDTGPQFVEVVGRVRNCAARVKLEQAAGVADVGTCQGVSDAIFVSQSHIFPTAMD